MEAKIAKIGLVILIATVAFRFMLTTEQKVELYSAFKSLNRNLSDFDFSKADFESKASEMNQAYANDYSGIRTKSEARENRLIYLAQAEENEPVPSDYITSDEFNMFSHLNNTDYSDFEEEYSEPLENYNTINASMKLFFHPAK